MTSSDLDDKTKSLNQSGAFLQIHLINQLKKHGWGVLPEYPVRISPFLDLPENDDAVKSKLQNHTPIEPADFVKAARNSMDKTTVKETSIDVVGGKFTCNPQRMCHLCIESKKLHPDFVDWVFFKKQTQRGDNLRLLVRSKTLTPDISLLKTPKTTKYSNETNLGICVIPEGSFDYPVCDFGVSLKSGKIDNEYYKSDKTKVDDATRQIMEGTYGFIVDTILQHILKGEPDLSRGTVIFFPIVVTNANLFMCEVNNDKIKPQTGHIEEDPKYEKVDSLIYECPVPNIIQFPEPLEANIDANQNLAVKKWHVLIFSPKGFTEFIKKLYELQDFSLVNRPF